MFCFIFRHFIQVHVSNYVQNIISENGFHSFLSLSIEIAWRASITAEWTELTKNYVVNHSILSVVQFIVAKNRLLKILIMENYRRARHKCAENTNKAEELKINLFCGQWKLILNFSCQEMCNFNYSHVFVRKFKFEQFTRIVRTVQF